MKLLAEEYQKHSKDELLISYGSSGKLYAQIRRGAPFQIFLSADEQKTATLEKQDLILPNSRFPYAQGVLVLWSAQQGLHLDNPDFNQLAFNKLAIANPRTAPYGLAAKQVLEKMSVDKTLKSKLVQGENIAQTFTFVKTGNADIGFIALSQYLQLANDEQGSMWKIPDKLHAPITQEAVLLRNASQSAKDFFEFLKGSAAKRIIASTGYRISEQG